MSVFCTLCGTPLQKGNNRMKNFWRERPALALFIVAPIFGELFSGSSPLNEFIRPLAFLPLAMLYGSGAVLAREPRVRWHRGWPSLLLLGAAYGVFEEGVMVRSFFDPQWMDLGALGVYGRALGVNWLWAYHLTVFHAVISVLASVSFVEILYPQRRTQAWVTRRSTWRWLWLFLFLTLPLGRLLSPYDAPDDWLLVAWLTMAALLALARRFPSPHLDAAAIPPAPPRRFFALGFTGVLLHHLALYAGADGGAYGPWLAFALTLAVDLLVLWLARRWSGRFASWDDRQRLALINGALAFFLLLAPLTLGAQAPVLYWSNPVFLLGLGLVYRRVAQREAKRRQNLPDNSPL